MSDIWTLVLAGEPVTAGGLKVGNFEWTLDTCRWESRVSFTSDAFSPPPLVWEPKGVELLLDGETRFRGQAADVEITRGASHVAVKMLVVGDVE